jgi:hypothetical protein
MNVLIVGVPNAKGSWIMRGQQLGSAMGARVTTQPVDADWQWADVIVLVKRAYLAWATQAQVTGCPIIWDALDCWRQPAENHVTPDGALAIIRRMQAAIRPTLTIAATQAMADAIGGVYLPHHSWQGLTPSAPRSAVKVVAYEGNEAYLGDWRHRLLKACEARGWSFVINPPDLRQTDILVAVRDGQYDGWICREWKSGVKLVNAMAAGRPVLSQPSAAFRELQPVGVTTDAVQGWVSALDELSDPSVRERALHQPHTQDFVLEHVAAYYQTLLQSVRASCAA